MKKAGIYVRVSTADQHVESQLYDLRELARQRGFQVAKEYEDRGVSGSKARRPGLDALMADARRKRFDVVLVAAFDRLARSTKHFLEVIDEFNALGIEFISAREGIDSSSPMGRFFTILVGCMAEAEKCMLVERIRSGMRRAKLEGKRLGRTPLQVNRAHLLRDREHGLSLNQLAKAHGISKASVCRVLKEEREAVSKGFTPGVPPCARNEGVREDDLIRSLATLERLVVQAGERVRFAVTVNDHVRAIVGQTARRWEVVHDVRRLLQFV